MRFIHIRRAGLYTVIVFIFAFTIFTFLEQMVKRNPYQNQKLISSQLVQKMGTASEISARNMHYEQAKEDSYLTNSDSRKRLPDCVIVGVSKCGTRAMLDYLTLHPEVVVRNEEVSYYYNASLRRLGLDWYVAQMPETTPQQLTVVKSPDCFQQPSCAGDMFKDNGLTKVIVLLRDPVERLVSQYMQLQDKHATLPTFEQWVIDQSTGQINTRIASVMDSAYAHYLVRWLSVFPRHQLHIAESHSLRVNPLREMKAVESFLKLTPYYSSDDFYYNTSRGFYCVRVRSTGKTKCLGKSKGREHIAVKQEILSKLNEFYRPYNQQLTELIGLKFYWT